MSDRELFERSIGAAIERGARELPEGYELIISIERHAGTVHWIDADGNEFDIDCGDTFGAQINNAIDSAITRAAEIGKAMEG